MSEETEQLNDNDLHNNTLFVYQFYNSFDFNLIDDHVFLGDIAAAETPVKLKEIDIKWVLSLLDEPLNNRASDINYCHIEADDHNEEDLLSHFNKSFQYINHAKQKEENVYIHCRAGISRSSTIVIAYMMKKYGLSYDDALKKVYAKRWVSPNDGFERQLRMYHDMNYVLDGRKRDYRHHLLNSLIYECNCSLSYFMKLKKHAKISDALRIYFEKLGNAESNQSIDRGNAFKCNGCGHVLFHGISVISAIPKDGHDESNMNCGNIYIEPQQWMNGKIENSKIGEMKCPNCCKELGHYNWERFQCDCPKHKNIKCLAFQIYERNIQILLEN